MTADSEIQPQAKPAILTVDDDPGVSRAVARDLRRRYGKDHRIVRAESGTDALDALKEMKLRGDDVAVLLADHRMPEMDGIQFLQVLRSTPEWAHTPVMLMTAFATPEQHVAAEHLKVSHEWTKASFAVRELRERIAECLNGGQRATVTANVA